MKSLDISYSLYCVCISKDYKPAAKRGLNLEIIDEVIRLLVAGETLPERYRDHALSGV